MLIKIQLQILNLAIRDFYLEKNEIGLGEID